MVNTAKKGRRNEHRSMSLLEKSGYWCMRSAASRGVFDVVAVSKTDIIFVQVKSGRRPGSVEMEEMALCPVPPNARKLVHVWKDRAQMPEVTEL